MNQKQNGGNGDFGNGNGRIGKSNSEPGFEKLVKGPILIKCPSDFDDVRFTAKVEGKFESGPMQIMGDLEIHGNAVAMNSVRTEKVVARSVKAPYLEGAIINRFINNTEFELMRGDVVALTMAPSICPGKTGEATLVLEAVDLLCVEGHKFAGVVVGDNDNGNVGFDNIRCGKTGYVCVGGIHPMVRVDRANFPISDGEPLIVGPRMSAVPEKVARALQICSIRVGFCLCNPEPDDGYVPVFVQPNQLTG